MSLQPSRAEILQAYWARVELFHRHPPDLLTWSRAFRVEAGDPLDFATFPFQVELYEAFGDRTLPTVDVMKSGQCGISAAAVSAALWFGDVLGANVLYVLPGGDDAYDFSDTRVKPAIEDDPYLSTRVASTDNKGLKRIGDANLYFRGSGSEKRALSIPADVLFLDEYDRLDQRNVPTFRKRLNSPKSLRLERRFSNPSYPEAGVHELYLDTDQRQWLVRCPKCRHERPLHYERGDGDHHVDPERRVRACGGCRRVLAPEAIGAGRWVAAQRGRPRGYHISRLIVPSEDIPAIVAEHAKTDEESVQAHFNFDLGLPYSPKGGSLSRELLLACRRDYEMPRSWTQGGWVTAGVDVGSVLHVRISRWLRNGKAVPLFLDTVPDFSDLAQLMRRYDVNFVVMDERPEERKAREFQKQFGGRVLLCRWSGSAQRDPIVVDTDKGLLIARRTGAFDRTIRSFEEQRRLLPRDLPQTYIKHLTGPVRVTETTARGQKDSRYLKPAGGDDYFLAECYDLLAKEARGGPPADAAGQDPDPLGEDSGRRGRIFR